MAYYIATGTKARATSFWNRRLRMFQPYACLDCVYPTYKGAARVYNSRTSRPTLGWLDMNATRDSVYWLLSQSEYEKQQKEIEKSA